MEFELSKACLISCPFAITSLICCKVTILYKPIAKSMRKGQISTPWLPNRSMDFDEIRHLELSLEVPTRRPRHDAKFHFDRTMWVVWANTQFATVTEKTISGVRVSPGSADTLVREVGQQITIR